MWLEMWILNMLYWRMFIIVVMMEVVFVLVGLMMVGKENLIFLIKNFCLVGSLFGLVMLVFWMVLEVVEL